MHLGTFNTTSFVRTTTLAVQRQNLPCRAHLIAGAPLKTEHIQPLRRLLMTIHLRKPILAALLAAYACAGAAQADDTYVAPVEDAVQLAQKQYASGRYGEAFGNFFWAAIREDARSQEIVGLMYLLGQKVYGPSVRADRAQAHIWLDEAAKGGRTPVRSSQCALAQADKRARAAALVMACVRD